MTTALKHALLCSLAGACLAAGFGVVLLSFGHVAGPLDLWPLLALGTLAAGGAGGFVSLRQRPAPPPPVEPTPAPPVIERRPARNRLTARIGVNLRWTAVSPRLCRLLRRPAAELRGQPVLNSLHPEDLGVVDQALQLAQNTGRPQVISCRLLANEQLPQRRRKRAPLRSDTQLLPPLDPRTFVYVRLRVKARFGAPGKVIDFRCRFADLTPVVQPRQELERCANELDGTRKKLRAVNLDLNRLKESYRELYHNAPVMYFSLDVQGKLVTFNDTLIRTLGHQRAELLRRDYTDLLAPGVERSDLNKRVPFTEGEVETQWQTKAGAVLDVWVSTVAVLDENGGFVRYRSAALDLTEKNRLANELRTRGDELEATNGRLRHINRELEDFTYVVSHDLKEPLRTLQTYSHILAEEHSAQLGPDGFQYINHLIHASRRLGHLIDDLLNLSQAGRIARAPQAFNLIEAVATVRQDLVDLIQRKEATLLTEGSLPAVVGDQHRITQLLTNLVANGLKYNQDPQPRVVIGATAADDPHRVVVHVRDNGIGIDPAFHEQIFGIFRRLHQADEYEGTGAGLAICKKVVEAHGGRIWVESQPGQGATFFFTLPRPSALARDAGDAYLVPQRVEPEPAAMPPAPAPKPAEKNGGPRIVLVEDNTDMGAILLKLGKKNGQHFTWFTTAEEAWEHLQTERPDFLLFDINLPGMSGVELCRRVRSLPALRATPIALFSDARSSDRLDHLRAAGANFFLSKDLLCNPAAWQKKLHEVLERCRG